MDRKFIKILIDNGKPFSEMASEAALILLNNQITEVYIKNGLHRTMTEEKFNEEVKFNAAALYKEIIDDKAYAKIRDQELHYIFSEGMKGRLGTDKDIVITFKSMLRWIEGYVHHAEYKEACRIYYEERMPKAPELPAHEMTDDEYKASIRRVYDEYVEYRKKLAEREAQIAKGIKSWERNITTIGEALGPPFELNDFGGFRMKWLIENGYAIDGEKLVDVFARAMANGGKFQKFNPK